jgi:uncharacterized protein YodC (DUF2158 family)
VQTIGGGTLRAFVESSDGLEQCRWIDRLGNVVVHAGIETTLTLLDRGVRRHRNHRQRCEPIVGT